MKFSLYSKKNVLDEMQEQTHVAKLRRRGFWLDVGRSAGRNGDSAADGQCR